MEAKFYEQIGRVYLDIVALHKEADKHGLYIGGGIDHYGDFNLRVYDASVSKSYYSTNTIVVTPANMDLIAAAYNEVLGFVNGFATATEIVRKRAEEAEKPEIDFMTGEPIKEESTNKEAA